ncbi:hypothetical protein [Saccharospirillum salsuginis]|uniref:GTPase n=1 Tax=Saccharospirillum salsuginis TaxID=418750 RepID=A0A918K315_9GAMM|nr:hypothetical protein [Saccharospirillum salsuginis]GGX45930.1 hypothetical protein GCM10007392_11210 [Saccharospirillum salsuginis]
MEHRPKQYLNIPTQTLTTLSFCDPSARQLKHWVGNLPMANIGETARQLYHAVIEFNQLSVNDASRLELMDLVRGPVHYVCQSLNQRYLNQGVVLDDQQRKVANLAQALQTHLATGYKIVVQHLLEQGQLKQRPLMAKAVHRTLCDLLPSILRSYQLYIPTPAGLWREVHQLYQVASAFNLHKVAIEDPTDNCRLSVQEVYLKAILLGASQPNQLLQRELTDAYQAMNAWVGQLDIDDVADEKSVLVINPEADHPPQYSYLIKPSSYGDYLGINTLPLVRLLHTELKAAYSANADSQRRAAITIPNNFGSALLEHLVQSWGGMKQRSFSRTQASGKVSMTVGLTGTHFHMSGGIGFYSQLYGQSASTENPFIGVVSSRFSATETQAVRSQQDVWDQSFDAGQRRMADPEEDSIEFPQEATEDHPMYSGQMVNVSPRGYCIQWNEKPATNLKTGEVVAIKEEKLQHWNLGVVRWLRQSKEAGTQMGVELIAPNSRPCGIRQLHKTGAHGDYLRALFIPEIRAIGQDASVLTPRLPFQVGNKVTINMGGNETKYQLTKRILSTGILSQFQIRKVAQRPLEPERPERGSGDDSFESLWRQL